VQGAVEGYWHISATDRIILERKPMGLVPAIWNAALTGGNSGDIQTFNHHKLEIVGKAAA